MSRRFAILLTAFALSATAVSPARAVVHAGNAAPDFHKTDLNGNPQTLFQYRGKVVIMFLLGWD